MKSLARASGLMLAVAVMAFLLREALIGWMIHSAGAGSYFLAGGSWHITGNWYPELRMLSFGLAICGAVGLLIAACLAVWKRRAGGR